MIPAKQYQYNFQMRNQKIYTTSEDSVMEIKIHEPTQQTNVDVNSPRFRFSKEKKRSPFVYVDKFLGSPKSARVKMQQKKEEKQRQIAPLMDDQLSLIIKLSQQILKQRQQNSFDILIKDQNSILINKFHKLFDLYIKQEILKHYCLKSGWKFQKMILDKYILPTFDLLAISKDKLSSMFQPFLKELTSRYILKTQLDTFSRLSPESLLIQLSQTWLRIKQSQIEIKRKIKIKSSSFKQSYCKLFNDKFVIDRNKLFNALFSKSKQIRMVNLIKIFIFCWKSTGENNQSSFEEWLDKY